MDKKDIISKFAKAFDRFTPILKRNNNLENANEAVFGSHRQDLKTTVKVFNFSEKELFSSPIKILLAQKRIANMYSETFIENQVVNLYHKYLLDESKKSELIQELISELIEKSMDEYFIISEIENIRILDKSKFQLIDSVVKRLEKEDFPFDEKDYSILGAGKFELLNRPVIFTKVKAGDNDKAKEIALHNFMISFNLLKLYAPNFKPVLKGCLLSGNQEIIVFNETDKSLSPNLSKVGELLLNHAYLNDELYIKLENAGIGNLLESNSISGVVKECLYWFGLGLEEKYPAAKLLNFVTVLESMLKRKDEQTELRRSVSERGSIFLYDRFEQRKEALKQLKTIYDIRSKVVHTGALVDDKDLVLLAGGYARLILIKIIKESNNFEGNFEKFLTYLDDLKLGKSH